MVHSHDCLCHEADHNVGFGQGRCMSQMHQYGECMSVDVSPVNYSDSDSSVIWPGFITLHLQVAAHPYLLVFSILQHIKQCSSQDFKGTGCILRKGAPQRV